MSQNDDEFRSLAEMALNILGISYGQTETLEAMLDKLRHTIALPASSTEWEIQRLAEEIANEIEARGDKSRIKELLERLEFEVTFLPFD